MALKLETLLTMTGSDRSLAIEILDIFESQVETWGRLLDASLPSEQWADAAHTIKGSALSIGASELALACERAEKRGREGQVSRVEAATLISDVKTQLFKTKEDCALARHKLSLDDFKASKASNS